MRPVRRGVVRCHGVLRNGLIAITIRGTTIGTAAVERTTDHPPSREKIGQFSWGGFALCSCMGTLLSVL